MSLCRVENRCRGYLGPFMSTAIISVNGRKCKALSCMKSPNKSESEAEKMLSFTPIRQEMLGYAEKLYHGKDYERIISLAAVTNHYIACSWRILVNYGISVLAFGFLIAKSLACFSSCYQQPLMQGFAKTHREDSAHYL